MIRNFKVLEKIGDKEYVFDSSAFKYNIHQYIADKKDWGVIVKTVDVKGDLAEKTCTTMDAINNWMYGRNGVSDLQMVKKIAEYFGINYMSLLRVKENKVMEKIENVNAVVTANMNNTKDVIRCVYQAMSETMDAQKTGALHGYDIEHEDECEKSYEKAEKVLHSSMLDIPMELYKKLESVLETLEFYQYGDVIDNYGVWETCEYLDYIKEKGFNDDSNWAEFVYMDYLADKFYNEMREILKDYITV